MQPSPTILSSLQRRRILIAPNRRLIVQGVYFEDPGMTGDFDGWLGCDMAALVDSRWTLAVLAPYTAKQQICQLILAACTSLMQVNITAL